MFFSIACSAALTSGSIAVTAAWAAALVQPTRAPAPYVATPGTRPYACQRRATIADTVADCDQVKDKCRSDSWKVGVAIAVAGVTGYLSTQTQFPSGDEPPRGQALLANGPELPDSYPDGSFSVRGFTRDGWPVVVDFAPQPGTVTQLEVTVATSQGSTKRTIVLDPDGSHGRQLVKVEMPAGGTPVATPATYLISSVPIASLDTDRPAAVRAAPLQVFGIGGGPRAVGSVAIEQLAFSRASVGARFSYVAKSEFSQARAEVQQFRRSGDRSEIVAIFDLRKSNLSVGRQTGDWPGTASGSPAPSRGVHRLQVTGWFTTDDRSWVAALAPDLVFQ
jgi:hypothetical protein